jgi:hypothetical protein
MLRGDVVLAKNLRQPAAGVGIDMQPPADYPDNLGLQNAALPPEK